MHRWAAIVGMLLLLASGTARARKVVLVVDTIVPASEFLLYFPEFPNCPLFHLHARQDEVVTGCGGIQIVDIFAASCGYTFLGANRLFDVPELAKDRDCDGVRDTDEPPLGLNPDNPDTDGDGVIDGAEDEDGDDLDVVAELALGTDPKKFDNSFRSLVFKETHEALVIPLMANNLVNSGVTAEQIREVVRGANEFLQDYNLRFVLYRLNDQYEALGDVDRNARLTLAEEIAVLDEGVRELQASALQGRGVKVHFVKELRAGMPSQAAVTATAEVETDSIIVEQGTVDGMTFGLIHGLGHLLGLADVDQLDGIMNPTVAPEVEGLLNLLGFSLHERALLRLKLAADHGLPYRRRSPAAAVSFEQGLVVDARDDTAGPVEYTDLGVVRLTGLDGEPTLVARIPLRGRLPETDPFSVSFGLGFDIDDDPSTGASYGPFVGVEQEVAVTLRRDAGEDGFESPCLREPRSCIGSHTTYQPSFVVETVEARIEDAGAFSPPLGKTRAADEVVIEIPTSLLGPTASQVPVHVMARDAAAPFGPPYTVFDTATLVLERDLSDDFATLTVFDEFTHSGDSVAFELAGMAAATAFDLTVDDAPTLTDTTDAAGGFAGAFDFPAVDPGTHFLVARDAAGGFAANAIDTLSVPGAVPPTITLRKSATVAGDVEISWEPGCSTGARDYGIYEGVIGDWTSHTQVDCHDDGIPFIESVTPGAGDRYYLVVPNHPELEGSYGMDGHGIERAAGVETCREERSADSCPP